ncbi:MAG: hypothetical protein K0Q51_299 [Rickettsiaceae bacterium]|nr:hypothetical protein [Rickettsiaceae bacterium]
MENNRKISFHVAIKFHKPNDKKPNKAILAQHRFNIFILIILTLFSIFIGFWLNFNDNNV